ncbi:MAG: orotidine-5'-phosphate decarboxylase [Pseudomonadales bacterium]|jgi:orotidine-5'-phosphate decarboxylase|nr:orotidine-5'-phosphate decarboxylase [Pseudomonadales bacterium]
MEKFITKLKRNLDSKNSHVCVGLDSQYGKLPAFIKEGKSISEAVFEFNKNIIDVTHDIAVIYKMNTSFYAGYGAEGMEGLRLTNEYIKNNYPDILTLADCKRSEMGESVKMVAGELFGWLGFDCVMVTPWFGVDTIRDYMEDDTKGVVVYIHDSNPSAIEIQDLELADGRKVYEEVARLVATDWNLNGNLWAEAGATYPEQLKKSREIIGDDMPLLVAGVGAQGGQPEVLKGLFGSNGKRLMVNSSRGIIFASQADNAEQYFSEVRQAASDLQNTLLQMSQL